MHRAAFSVPALVLAAALCALAGACSRPAPREAPVAADITVPVAARPVQRGTIRTVIRASGLVTAARDAEILVTAPEPARVLEIPKEAGDRVASGDVLVRFDLPSARAQAVRQQAELATVQAQFENARIAQGRARDLVERGLLARRDLENANREVADAEDAVARAQAALAAAEAAVARATVRAPFAGIVAQRLHDPGDLVLGSAADPVLRVVDPNRLEITASVAAADAPRVLPGATARLAGPSGAPPGRLTVVSRSSPAAGTDAIVRLAFVDPATASIETPVQIDIDAEERPDALFVPVEALIRDGGGPAVFVAVGARAERRPVTTGLADEERVEIRSGLGAGELVITRGHVGLNDGAAITVDVER